MGSFDDLDEGLLEIVLQWLNSTELRSGACLVCKRWLSACNSRPGLWRDLDINASWEVYHSQILRSGASVAISRAHYHVSGAAGGSSSRGRGRSSMGESPSGRCGFWPQRRPNRPAFLSRASISRWLQRRAPHVEILRISHTELRISVVGYGRGAAGRNDLQPSDLMAMLAAMPSLTELHLISACNLLPDLSVLFNLPSSPPEPAPPQPPPAPQLAPSAPTPTSHNQGADAAAAAAGGAAAARPMARLPPAPTQPLTAALPLSERLRRLSLCRGGYEFDTPEGAAQAAALGGLRGLQGLSITLEPAAEEGLLSIPEAWSALTGLTALHLGGHQRLRQLPSWLSCNLRHLRELTLEGCGLRRVPYTAVSGLRELRLLNLDRCPLGRSAAVSLDAWWPPGEEAGGGGGDSVEGGGGGMAGLEVLQLRKCDILALPYTVTRLTNLRRLELGGNPLGDLAQPGITDRNRDGNMRAAVLRYLQESGDRGFSQLVCLTRLRHLGLDGCGLATVPLGVIDLTQLTSLDLGHNAELELYSGRVADLAGRLPQLECLHLEETTAGRQLRELEHMNLLGLRSLILE